MSDEDLECPPCPAGLPGWLATFADLMSLLMCFFVLLLSFSEMDVLKFKQLAGSMKEAFGVQNQIKVEDVPKGTSIIAQEFSPGRPEPTPLNEVRQMTINNAMNTLDVRSKEGENDTPDQLKGQLDKELKKQEEEAKEDAVQIAATLALEVGNGSIEVETESRKVIIRIKENGSFESGTAELKFESIPVLAKIRDLLLEVKGKVAIEGHTDDLPYSGFRYQSNWDLSAARALAVANELFGDYRIDQSRFMVIGYASTKPLVPNETREQRAKNRRVEIVIHKGEDSELLEKFKVTDPNEPGLINLNPTDVF